MKCDNEMDSELIVIFASNIKLHNMECTGSVTSVFFLPFFGSWVEIGWFGPRENWHQIIFNSLAEKLFN